MSAQELIIFVDEDGTPTGEIGPKLDSHNAHTKLHLAFSCYVFRKSDNKFLVTQRALSKKVWPGVWSNSFCGHPAPGEAVEAAIRRRGAFELGLIDLQDIKCVLPKYVYITPPYKGVVEHEFCPIYIAHVGNEPTPNPDEVEAYTWISWSEYATMLAQSADEMSYWCKDQYALLKDLHFFRQLGR